MTLPLQVRSIRSSDALFAHDVPLLVKYVFNWYQNDIKTFAHFCEALEVDNGKVAPKEGWGLDHAMTAWGKYWNETFYPLGACQVTRMGGYANFIVLQFAEREMQSAHSQVVEWFACTHKMLLQELLRRLA